MINLNLKIWDLWVIFWDGKLLILKKESLSLNEIYTLQLIEDLGFLGVMPVFTLMDPRNSL